MIFDMPDINEGPSLNTGRPYHYREIKAPQGSDEWLKARMGRITASNVNDILRWGGKHKAKRALLLRDKAYELLTGSPKQIEGKALDWGSNNEAVAREAYSERYGVEVEEISLVKSPHSDRVAGSPDGGIDEGKGIIEIKCPYTEGKHLTTIKSGKVPSEYVAQCQTNMMCCEADYCDFISFDPRLPEPYDMFVVRISRDEDKIKEIIEECSVFLHDLDEYIESIEEAYKED